MGAKLADIRFWLLAGALALVAVALAAQRIRLTRPVVDVLAVVYVTGSMNVRDMTVAGEPASRLEAAQAALRALLTELPCQSRLGLGVFTERASFLLFEPAEICENFAALDGAIRELDWRMAWAGDSYVTRGLDKAIAIAASAESNLLFITDGHEAPPMPAAGLPEFEGKAGEVRGLIVGAGSRAKTQIPKFDSDGREIGSWGPQDVPHENRIGGPPKGAEDRPGFHPRYAPFGAAASEGQEHLSSVRDEHLKALAARTGLSYATLAEAGSLVEPLLAASRRRSVELDADIRPYPAAAALALLVLLFGLLPVMSRIGPLVSRYRQRSFSKGVAI